MELGRRKFQGVLNILSFNRHFYIFGLIALTFIIASHLVFSWPDLLYWIIISSFLYGLIMPLIVSAYVYDFSGYYNFNWLKGFNIEDSGERQILNINAGFDETSFIIKNQFPQSALQVFDFYNAERHTEPAIVRARKVSLVYPGTQQVIPKSIPLKIIQLIPFSYYLQFTR
jgi:energy-coupling factor transporter transmembrane protein EcfT